MDFQLINQILPQKRPFLMIDKVIEFQPNIQITCVKYVSANDPIFDGHFPDNPVYPGVLIIESMAQASILLFSENISDNYTYYLGSTKIRFQQPVGPGDQIYVTVSVIRKTENGAIVKAQAEVDGVIVSQGELGIAIVKKN